MVYRLRYIINILIVTLLLAAVAIARDGRLLGDDVEQLLDASSHTPQVEVESTLPDGTRVINTTSIAKDIIGFGGRTPVNLYVKDDVIERVEPLPNSETPSFWDEIVASPLFEEWRGMSVVEAANRSVNVVSGATQSSISVVENVRRGAQYAAQVEGDSISLLSNIGVKSIVGLIVILLGAILSLANVKSRVLTTIQLILNVAILGFWCGSFLSLTTLTAWISSGVNLAVAVVSLAMLVVTLIMPLFGRRGTYCHLCCPLGSAQELLGRLPITPIRINQRVAKVLNRLRYYILVLLLFMMWLGVGFDLMNYELFSAFIISSASTFVLVMAVVFLLLSLVITRPYCRFVCPTGALITISQRV